MTPPNDRQPANCLAHIAQDNNHAVIIAVLRESEVARQSSFSLMEEDDYALLAREVAKDFPYLTVENLEDAMMLGVKGKLDTYKTRPLNFTRVYQWVEQRAPYSLGYWRTRCPEIIRWAELCNVLEGLMPKVYELYAKHGYTNITFTVTEHIGKHYYPASHSGQKAASKEVHDVEVHNAQHITHNLFPVFAAEYPDFAAKHAYQFCRA